MFYADEAKQQCVWYAQYVFLRDIYKSQGVTQNRFATPSLKDF